MRIGLQTWGSEGDVRPFLALGHGLRRAGHEVSLVVASIENRDYGALCQSLDLEYFRVPDHMNFDMTDFGRANLDTNGLEWTARLLEAAFVPYQELLYKAAEDLCRECDLVIGHYLVHPLKAAAQMSLTPHMTVTLSHGSTPSDEYPPGILMNRGIYANQLAWKLHMAVQDTALRPLVQNFWLEHKLPTMKHVYEYWTSDLLDLVTVSPVFREEPPEWAPDHRMCGFMDLPRPETELTDNLKAFLENGPPPVFLTLGVLMKFAPNHYMILAHEAVRQAGCRAIIHIPPELAEQWPLDRQSEDGSIFYGGPVSHSAIFPHCTVVVHHGGAGTAQEAVNCGKPSLVVGFQDEQMFWGKELKRLGVSGEPIIHQNVTAENLARGIKKVLDDETLTREARELADRLAGENGVDRAVQLIHSMLPGLGETNEQ